jgi:hypothetical protein
VPTPDAESTGGPTGGPTGDPTGGPPGGAQEGMSGRPPLPPLRSDGLPTLATGEPVLARWFVITMLLLVPIAIAVSIVAWQATDREPLGTIDRRPVGGPTVTIDRGDAQFPEATDTEPGPDCVADATLIGDGSARAAARRSLGATCQLVRDLDLPTAAAGIEAWLAADGLMRVGVFERSGIDASTRLEDGRLVLELNARFLFEDATRAAPALIHQFVLMGQPDWPGETVTADAELTAAREQLIACARLVLPAGAPRACSDAEELLALDDPRGRLVAAGFRDPSR